MNMQRVKIHCWMVGAFALLPLSAFSQSRVAQQDVVIDGTSSGRIFDGIGAVSAGASSRLLIDYPEPYRSQILDYLFRPGYGASLQHLKVEIGGDVNSTDGSEPSHMRSKDDHDYDRGYEWWLMKEAQKRNPHIILDSLPWGASGWVGNGHLYSADMAHYVGDFIQGAKKAHNLDIAYTGIWNETTFDGDYVKTLRQMLDAAGLKTKIVCCDQYPRKDVDEWSILGAMDKDLQLNNAVAVVSVHYPRMDGKLTTPPAAFHLGKPLWSSEDQPASSASTILSRDWSVGGRLLAQLYNENYLKGGFTKTEIWSPVTSYYDILAAPNSGLMYANTPWSGHYDVQGAIWATAHTTQFAQPGWQYLDLSSGNLPEHGDYVSLKSADAKDWSVVLETIDATHPQQVHFKLAGGLRGNTVHVWETNAKRTFEHVADVAVDNGLFTYTFDPDSLYSLTTTTGQGKGRASPPAQRPFPLPYHEDFKNVPLHGTPHYLSDQDGAFQVERCAGRTGNCLEEVITQKPTPWGPLPDPWTLAGDSHWTDYEVDAGVRLEGAGDITLMGRIDSADIFKDKKARYPSGYVFVVDELGTWKLLSCAYNKPVSTLATGKVDLAAGKWHRFGMIFRQNKITVMLDGQALSSVQNSDHPAGMFGVGTGWNRAQFDDLMVKRLTRP